MNLIYWQRQREFPGGTCRSHNASDTSAGSKTARKKAPKETHLHENSLLQSPVGDVERAFSQGWGYRKRVVSSLRGKGIVLSRGL